jgi:hypothetical protein
MKLINDDLTKLRIEIEKIGQMQMDLLSSIYYCRSLFRKIDENTVSLEEKKLAIKIETE